MKGRFPRQALSFTFLLVYSTPFYFYAQEKAKKILNLSLLLFIHQTYLAHQQVAISLAHYDTGMSEERKFERLDGYEVTSMHSVITNVKSRIRCSVHCMEQMTPKCVSYKYVNKDKLCQLSTHLAVDNASPRSQVYQIEGTHIFANFLRINLFAKTTSTENDFLCFFHNKPRTQTQHCEFMFFILSRS